MTLLPGAKCSQLLSLGEGDLALDPSLCFSQWTNPSPHTPSITHPLPLAQLSFTPLLSFQRSLSPPLWSFSPPPLCFSAPIHLAQQGVANSLRSANFHTFPAWDANTSSVPHYGTATPPTNTDTHAYKTQFSTPARPHTHWAFRSERTRVAHT